MCNNGAKDNLGQIADFIWLSIRATVCECPHPGIAAMNDRAASGSYFNIGEAGMLSLIHILLGLCSSVGPLIPYLRNTLYVRFSISAKTP